jgi:hypothetical protein
MICRIRNLQRTDESECDGAPPEPGKIDNWRRSIMIEHEDEFVIRRARRCVV